MNDLFTEKFQKMQEGHLYQRHPTIICKTLFHFSRWLFQERFTNLSLKFNTVTVAWWSSFVDMIGLGGGGVYENGTGMSNQERLLMILKPAACFCFISTEFWKLKVLGSKEGVLDPRVMKLSYFESSFFSRSGLLSILSYTCGIFFRMNYRSASIKLSIFTPFAL
jgi:hypothetical protein